MVSICLKSKLGAWCGTATGTVFGLNHLLVKRLTHQLNPPEFLVTNSHPIFIIILLL